MSGFTSSESLYRQRSERFAAEATRLARHNGKLTLGRAVTFLIGASCLAMAGLDANLRTVWVVGGLAFMAAFLTLAIYHDWLNRCKERSLHLQRINVRHLDRCLRNWRGLPKKEVAIAPHHEAIARDLDLFGHCSLFQLVNLSHTPRGAAMLRDWLLEPTAPPCIAERQAAVRELTDRWELREELALRGEMLAAAVAGPEAFEAWAESEPYLSQHPRRKWISRLLPAAMLGAVLALASNLLSPEIGGLALLLSLFANILFSVRFNGDVQDIFNNISTRCGEMRHYMALFDLLGQVPTGTARLDAIRDLAVREEHGAVHQMKRLRGVMVLANLRHASLLSILYFGLQATVLWDFHVLFLLERWQRRCGGLARRWFDALAELETLASFSNLAFDHPDWAFPDVSSTTNDRFAAVDLGHPLLSSAVRVANDVEVGPSGTVLLVTGSNMSGKSTLLRAIGLNAILAGAGAPVCAKTLRMPSVVVATSMRIQDSLEDGISFYMAELKRLKVVVDQATKYAQEPSENDFPQPVPLSQNDFRQPVPLSQGGPQGVRENQESDFRTVPEHSDRRLLYLLDEILLGTNSVERHIAVSRVLAHLVAKGALGAVSTHDLDLAKSSDLAQSCRPVHFRETLHGQEHGQQMSFDYKLREGVASTTNALKLLELVGLG